MTIRSLQKARLLQRDLSLLLPKVLEWDKTFSKNFPSIVRVELNGDGRLAKIYVRFPQKSTLEILRRLRSHEGALRHALAPLITNKILPSVRFYIDEQLEKEQVMAALWSTIHADLERAQSQE